MSETKQIEGILKGFGVIKTGETNNKAWTLYKYTLGSQGRDITLSGFQGPEELVGKYVIIAYTESPNQNPKFPPYKNAVNITEGVSPQELQETNKRYNVVGISPGYDMPHNPAFFGMVFNKTVEWIMNERAIVKNTTSNAEYTLDENFDKIFEHLWEKAIAKRKEKLGE